MKKYLVVLLIAVLAVSSVFAGITGYIQAKYEVNFDKGTFAFTDPEKRDDLKARITMDTLTAEKKSDAKTHIDAKVSFGWNSKEAKGSTRYALDLLGYFQLTVDKFAIVGQDWSLNLLAAEKLGGYATSTLDSITWYRNDHLKGSGVNDDDKETKPYTSVTNHPTYYLRPDMRDASEYKNVSLTYKDDYADYQKVVNYGASYSYYGGNDDLYGVTLSLKGWKAALGINGTKDAYEYNTTDTDYKKFYFAVETPDFAFADVNMKAAAGFSYRDNYASDDVKGAGADSNNNKWVIGASYKAAYATEKFSADFATDQGVKIVDEAKSYSGDYLANVDFAPVKATVFFGKDAESKKSYDTSYGMFDDGNDSSKVYKKFNYYFTKGAAVYEKATIADLLSFQVAADLNKYDIPVKVTFTGKNMLAKSKIFSVSADWQALDNLSFTVYGKDLLSSYDRINNDADTKAYFTNNTNDGIYWKNNGDSQKVGLKAAYALNDALSFTGEGYFKIAAYEMGFNVAAKYAASLFTANASIDTVFLTDNKVAKSGDKDDYAKMQFKVSAESDKLVDGALLKLAYESGNLINNEGEYDWYVGQQAGKFKATCKVTF